MSDVTQGKVDESAVAPAGRPDECFWCTAKIGDDHKTECVTQTRKVKVRAIIEYEIDAPRSWTAHDIVFHRNYSSWCADNIVNELQQITESGACLCDATKFEVVE